MASWQEPKRRPSRRSLPFWLALAVLIHAEVLLVVGIFAYMWSPRNADMTGFHGGEQESIEISTLDDETARKILAELEREQEKAEEEKTKKEVESPNAPGQVVELPKPREEKRPDHAKFAAEHDSSVEQQTKKHGQFNEKARLGDAAGKDEVSRPANEAAPQKPVPSKPGAMAMRTPGPERSKTRVPVPGPHAPPSPPVVSQPGDPLDTGIEAGGTLSAPGRELAVRPPGGAQSGSSAPQAQPGAPALVPSQQQIARAVSSGTQDYLKDIDEGDETALNAKKWKFSSFFNRIKQQVRDHWKPADEYRRRDPTGAIYGQKDRYTLLRVQLKPDGTLANVALELPSGIEFLDDEAIEAFKQAQPFPNPPRQLVEEGSGMINFRFGFFFELSGSPKMKIFRYNSM